MKQEEIGQEWAKSWTLAIGQQLAKVRRERGLSARELSEKTEKLGYPIPRNSITNLENGRKTSVSVAEIAVLSMVLEVQPVLLLYPMSAHSVELMPGISLPPLMAVDWFSGQQAGGGEEDAEGTPEDEIALRAARRVLRARSNLHRMNKWMRRAVKALDVMADPAGDEHAEMEQMLMMKVDEAEQELSEAVQEAERLGVTLPVEDLMEVATAYLDEPEGRDQ